MLNNNKTLKKVITITVTFCLLLFIGVLWKVLSVNMNPDRVNLNNGNWNLIFSFTTYKGTDVRLYGKNGKTPNTGEFVIVRNWPFKCIQLISPVFFEKNVWELGPLYPAKGYDAGVIYEFGITLGYFFGERDSLNYYFAPSLRLAFYQNRQTGEFHFFSIQYMHCDEIPILKVFNHNFLEPEEINGCQNPIIHNNPLETIPFEGVNDY